MEDPLDKLSVKFGRFEAAAAGRFAILVAVAAGLSMLLLIIGGRLMGAL